MFIHPQWQAILHASAALSRKPASAVVALTAAIGGGTVDTIGATLGWQDCRPAKVRSTN